MLTCVQLVLSAPLTVASTYTLTVSNISDCSGNALSPATISFSYYIPQQYDVTINEIMADPDPVVNTLPDYEYIELYNKTAFPININNWTLTVGTNTKVLPDVFIPADSFLVLTSTTGLPNFPSGINVVAVTSFPALTNTGASISIKNAAGAAISSVSYTDDWYQDDAKKDGGYSIEQIDPSNPCAGMGNWRASNDANGGTPGYKNSVYGSNPDVSAPDVVRVSVISTDTIQLYFNEAIDSSSMLSTSVYSIDNSIGTPSSVIPVGPDFKSVRLVLSTPLSNGIIYTITVAHTIMDCVGNVLSADDHARFAIPQPVAANDIVINEVLFNPFNSEPDFVEIYNRSGKVMDLKDLMISQYDTTISTLPLLDVQAITAEGFLIFPGEYIVLSENGNAIRSRYATSNPEGFFDVADMITMDDGAGTVCLSTATDIIDRFKYTDDMHFALLNDKEGVSLERIDFERSSMDLTNWHSAAASVGYATPGYKNSQYNDAGETGNAIEITPEIFSPDEDGTNDVVNINYHFDTPGFVANVTVYDSRGRMIRRLVKNEYLGINGTFSWDGISDENEKGRIGIYIFYIEVFDLEGNVKKFKKTCVLASKL
jgi:hypothetical protein